MSTPALEITAPSVSRVDWAELGPHIANKWEQGEHITAIAKTGGGKSYLIRHGLMPMCRNDRICVIDCKGDDPTWRGFGTDVTALPRYRVRQGPEHYRLLVHDDRADGRAQVHAAMERMYKQKEWIIVLDETRAVYDSTDPGLGLRGQVERLWLRGRSRELTVIAGTQAPTWVPSSMYSQASHLFIGRILDRRARQRLREIGGNIDVLEHAIASLQPYEFVVVTDYGESLYITKVK